MAIPGKMISPQLMNRNPNSQILGTDPGADLTCLPPSGTKELLRSRQEAGIRVLPDFTSSVTVTVRISVAETSLVECSQAHARPGESIRLGLYIRLLCADYSERIMIEKPLPTLFFFAYYSMSLNLDPWVTLNFKNITIARLDRKLCKAH